MRKFASARVIDPLHFFGRAQQSGYALTATLEGDEVCLSYGALDIYVKADELMLELTELTRHKRFRRLVEFTHLLRANHAGHAPFSDFTLCGKKLAGDTNAMWPGDKLPRPTEAFPGPYRWCKECKALEKAAP